MGAAWSAQASGPEVTFSADGKPASFIVREAEGNLVRTDNPGSGFYLSVFEGDDEREVPLSKVVARDGALIVSPEEGLPRFTFEITRGASYIALKLKRAEGIPDSGGISLHFRMNCRKEIRVLPLDYMIEARAHGPVTVVANWKHLWHRNPKDPLGGFAVYGLDSDDQNDEALTQIWVNEDIPKPKINGAWTAERVRRWVDDYARRFQDLTAMVLSASSPAELQKLTDYAQQAGVKVVKLHTDTWRGEYWPQKRSHVDVNPDVFPGGRADLKRYADDLHRRGMLLVLHYVCGGIGSSDPRRVMGHVDRCLASWGKGCLAEAIDGQAQTLRFKPSEGTQLPLTLPHLGAKSVVGDFMNTGILRIEDEIVGVGTFEDLDKPVWTLKDCHRGRGGTPVAPHPAGAEAAGLLSAYGQNYIPDLDSPLLEEMAGEYAAFANEIGLDHLEYDGYEIHAQYPWGPGKFSDVVARALDHPVSSNTSGGRPVRSNLEMLFSKVRKIDQFGGSSAKLSLLLEGHRPATSLLDANFELQAGVARGFKRFVICKPEPMFGVSLETLDSHGLVKPMMNAFRNWKRVSELLTDEQRAVLAKSVEPVKSRLVQAGNHVQSRDLYCVGESGGKLALTPTRVMIRREGDAPWLIGQEFGPAGPWQYCQPGDVLELENPFKPQAAGFVIRVLPELGGTGSGTAAPVADPSKDSTVVDSYRTGAEAAGNGDVRVGGPVNGNLSLQPKAAEIRNQRHTAFAQDGGALVLSANNPTGEAQWIENDLPSFRRNFSMEATRAIGMEITGDNSGAIFLLQAKGRGTRDYVVKINFTGKKTIVIPNGEAAWANGWWGWRMGSKHFDYGKCGRIDLGFGYIPPGSQPRIKLENLRLIPSQPSRLVNPVIQTGSGHVRITGEIETGQYLEFDGKGKAQVYDKNWNRVKELQATAALDYLMPHGYGPVKVEVPGGSPRPWLAVRYIVKGESI